MSRDFSVSMLIYDVPSVLPTSDNTLSEEVL
jgi:hypothetical protein